jgi:hypothetical protein
MYEPPFFHKFHKVGYSPSLHSRLGQQYHGPHFPLDGSAATGITQKVLTKQRKELAKSLGEQAFNYFLGKKSILALIFFGQTC